MAGREIGETNNKNIGSQTDNPGLKKQISHFTKSLLYGHKDRHLISFSDRQSLKEATDTARELLDSAVDLENQHQSKDMWDKAVIPQVFKKRCKKARISYGEAYHHNNKKVTSQDTNALLSQLRIDCDKLSELVRRLRKQPGERKTFTRKDRAFFAILGTPLGQIVPFMLYQNPKEVGDRKMREVTSIEVNRSLGAPLHLILGIGQTKDSGSDQQEDDRVVKRINYASLSPLQ